MSVKSIRQSDRAFGLTFAAVFAVAAAAGWLLFDARLAWAVAASAAFLVIALATPGLLLPLNRLWTAFARRLGRLNNVLLLGAFFYLVVLPAGLVMRLLGHDPMTRRLSPDAPTYWTTVGRKSTPDTLRDMF
jgi:hypothetical protein